jgi:hypothetical protein
LLRISQRSHGAERLFAARALYINGLLGFGNVGLGREIHLQPGLLFRRAAIERIAE